MATIAFAAATAGTAITATAFATGMMMAGIIDQMFVMPLLFPAEPVEGMRIGEIGLMGADEGMPVTYAFGQYAKVAGQIIWVHNLEEVAVTERMGKSGKRITYFYYISHAVAICNVGRNAAGATTALASVDAVFADEKRVYADSRTLLQDETVGDGVGVIALGAVNYVFFVGAGVATHYNKWAVGDTVSFTGFADAGNNDAEDTIVDKKVIEVPYSTGGGGKGGTGGSSGVHEYEAFQMQKGKVPVAPGPTVTLTGVQYSGWADDMQRSGEPTIYLGANASANSHMNVAGDFDSIKYYDTAYIVFDSLNMSDYGTRIPNWEFIVSSHTDYRTVPGIITQLLTLANFSSSQFDVSEVSESVVVGYSMKGPTSTQKLLQPLMITFNVLAQERGQKLYFMDRADNVARTYTVDMDSVGAAMGTESKYMGVEIQNTPMNQKFGEVTFTHISQDDNHFPQGQAKAQLAPHTGAYESVHDLTKFQVNTPIVCTNAFASEVAHRILFASHADDMKFIFRLSVKQAIKYQENDRVKITVNGKEYPILIHKVTLGADLIAEVEGALDRAIEQDFSGWQENVGWV